MTTSQVSTVIADPASVDAAIESRFSARAFLPRPVAREVLADLLRVASRAPSGAVSILASATPSSAGP